MDGALVISHLSHLVFAYLLAMPIGWERELSKRQFGLRTFPLVAVVTCGFMLVGMSVIDNTDGEARVMQGLITGIGFIGGGAILKDEDKVAGVSSAASIWNTGAIGLAVAFDRFEIAILLAALNVFTLYVFGSVKKTVDSEYNNEED
ncbi:MAG TPA: MgtC/SapB family protein [Desulfosarcina sp.]|nr:MgtC/SapB family protein [Desulfosarcina sp.]